MDLFVAAGIIVLFAAILVDAILRRSRSLEKRLFRLRSIFLTEDEDRLNDLGKRFGVNNHGEPMDKKLENGGEFCVVTPQEMGV